MLVFVKYNRWAFLWGSVIILLTVLPGDYVPDLPDFYDLFRLDKLIHVAIFAIYFLLQARSFIRQPIYPWFRRNTFPATLALCMVLGGGTELAQHYLIPHRTGSVVDLIANLAGCGVGYLIGRRYEGRGRRDD